MACKKEDIMGREQATAVVTRCCSRRLPLLPKAGRTVRDTLWKLIPSLDDSLTIDSSQASSRKSLLHGHARELGMASAPFNTLANRGRQVFAFFNHAVSLISQHHHEQIREITSSVQEQAQRPKLWAIDLGLLVPDHGSLDYRVREAEGLRRTLATYLDDLAHDLKELIAIVSFQTLIEYEASISEQKDTITAIEGGDDSSDDEDIQHRDYAAISATSIADIIEQLFRLSTRIRNPTTRLASTKANDFSATDEDSGQDLVEAYKHWDYCHVLAVFAAHACQTPTDQFQHAADFYSSEAVEHAH